MKCSLTSLALLLGLVATGCSQLGEDQGTGRAFDGAPAGTVASPADDGDGQEIPLDQVPEAVKQAALAAVPGLVLEEAEQETEGGALVYCLEGSAAGQEYEVEVSANGQVLEVEQDEDDGDDDDGDDDDDDDEDPD